MTLTSAIQYVRFSTDASEEIPNRRDIAGNFPKASTKSWNVARRNPLIDFAQFVRELSRICKSPNDNLRIWILKLVAC